MIICCLSSSVTVVVCCQSPQFVSVDYVFASRRCFFRLLFVVSLFVCCCNSVLYTVVNSIRFLATCKTQAVTRNRYSCVPYPLSQKTVASNNSNCACWIAGKRFRAGAADHAAVASVVIFNKMVLVFDLWIINEPNRIVPTPSWRQMVCTMMLVAPNQRLKWSSGGERSQIRQELECCS